MKTNPKKTALSLQLSLCGFFIALIASSLSSLNSTSLLRAQESARDGTAGARPVPDAAVPDAAVPDVTATQKTTVDASIVDLQSAVERAIQKAEKSVVSIARVDKDTLEDPTSPDFVPKQFGTGVAIAEQGLILTCYHLLGDPDKHAYYVWLNGVPFKARKAEKVTSVVGADPWTDLAVLKIDARLTPIRLATDFKPRRGQFIVSLGNPYGIAKDGHASATFGIISNLLRQRTLRSASEWENSQSDVFSQYGTLLQTDAKLFRGTSGGPLLNLKGEMVGMTTALTAANHFADAAGFAIPVDDTFRGTVHKLKQGRSAEFGFLGIATKELTLAQRQQFNRGVIVTQVVENTPADSCGLKFGDVITHVNEMEIVSSNAMLRELSGRFADSEITLQIQRKPFPNSPYRKLELKVRLGKKKVDSKQPAIGINDFSNWRGIKVEYPTAISNLSANASKIDPKGCVVVVKVSRGSQGELGGIRELDFVSHVNGKRVSNPQQFFAAVESQTGPVELSRVKGQDRPVEKIVIKSE